MCFTEIQFFVFSLFSWFDRWTHIFATFFILVIEQKSLRSNIDTIRILLKGSEEYHFSPKIFYSYLLHYHLTFPRFLNPFVPNATFFYPLKTSENLTVFWCFQGVEKGCIGNKWVTVNVTFSVLTLFSPWYFNLVFAFSFCIFLNYLM